MKKYFLQALIILPVCATAQDDCAFGFENDSTYSIFPMENINKTWKWFESKKTELKTEYLWSIEAGSIKNNEFIADGVLMAFSIGSFNTGNGYLKNGSMHELISDGSGSIYYSNRNKNSIIPMGKKNIYAKIDEESLVIYSTSNDIKDFILQTNPSHVKMTYESISKIDNYSCITKIIDLNND